MRVVKAFGQEQRELERVADAAETLYGSQMRAVRLQARYQPLLRGDPVARARSRSWRSAAGWRCTTRSPSAPSWPSPPTSPSSSRRPASSPACSPSASRPGPGVERIFQLLDLPPAIADAPGRGRAARAARRDRLRRRALRLRRRRAGARRASTCTSRAGERVALVGPSGSGKSTRRRCWSPRFYDPTAGAVLRRRPRRARRDAAVAAPPGRRRLRGELPVLRHGARQHRLRAAGRDRRRGRGGGPRRAGARVHRASCRAATTRSSASAA